MNSIDSIILVILAIFVIKGMFRGIILEAFTLVGLIIAYVIALREMGTITSLMEKKIALPQILLSAISFFLIFILIVLFARWIAGVLRRLIRGTPIVWLDKGGGILLGLCKGALIASLLALLLSVIPVSKQLNREQENSFLFKPICSVAPAVFNLLKKSLPKTKDFYQECKEGFEEKSKGLIDQTIDEKLESIQKDMENRD
jgi:membrane protein required for colicin V production